MWAITINTLKETYRKKIFAFVAVFTVIYTGAYALMLGFLTAGMRGAPANGLLTNFSLSSIVCIIGLYFSTMLTAFLAIMLSLGSISLDIESSIIQAVITKPLKRYKYVLGKFIGISIFIAIYSIILYALIMLIPQLIGIDLAGWFGLNAISRGAILFIFESIILIAVSIFGSVYFKTLPNGIFLVSLYIISVIGGFTEQIGALLSNNTVVNMGIISSLISPFDTIYRKTADIIFSGNVATNPFSTILTGGSSTSPSSWMLIYSVLYMLAFLFIGIRKFNRKDI